jgi:Right handed beta helix region
VLSRFVVSAFAVAVVGSAACRQSVGSAEQSAAAAGESDTRACSPEPTFVDERAPTVVRHVSTSGDEEHGDGSALRPFRTIERAARDARPGTAIHIHAGSYEGRTLLTDLHGTADAPIWIIGAPGEPRPVIHGGAEGLHLIKPRYVAIENLEIRDTADNGINVDDGDDVANPEAARFMLFRDLDIHDTGKHPSGVANCLKLAGVNDVVVTRSSFARCGNGADSGSLGVDGVGVHRAVVRFNRFESTGFGGVQFKGGSDDIEIRGNWFLNAGWRGVAMGGSTGDTFYRPPLRESGLNAEAANVRVVANVFAGGEAAAAFTGCVDCQFVHNTVVDPTKWVLRVLQERVTDARHAFAPASYGQIAGNIFYFRRSDLNAGEDINVGAGTDTQTFSLFRNLWYAHDQPSASSPRLSSFLVPERESIVGTNPDFEDARAGNFRLKAASAARAAGRGRVASGGDVYGHCFADAPSLGAVEYAASGARDR